MYIELKTLTKSDEEYLSLKKSLFLHQYVSYPVYLNKSYFISDKVLGLLKEKNNKLYFNLLKKIDKKEVIEIKVI